MARWIRLLLMCCIVPIHAQSDWVNLGPYGGEFDAMAIDVKRPNILYIGTRTGQIFRSTDAGQNWAFYSAIDGQITKLVVDSSNGHRLYAGITDNLKYSRIYYSTDEGLTWKTNTSEYYYNEPIVDIIINPSNATQLYLVTTTRAVRSVNSGQSFPLGAGGFSLGDGLQSVAYDPHDPENRMYAAGYYAAIGADIVMGTRNGWSNNSFFTPVTPGWKIGKIYAENTGIAAVYVLMGKNDSTMILRSANYGDTWTMVFEDNIGMYQGDFRLGQYAWIQRSKNSPEHIVATQNGLLKTNDGGLSWYRLHDGIGNNLNQVRGGTFVRTPTDTSLFYCNYGKKPTRLSITPGGYVASTTVSFGFTAQEVKRIHASQGSFIIAETQTRDIIYSNNYGQDFTTSGISLSSGDAIVGGNGFFVTKRGQFLNIQGSVFGAIDFPPGTDSVINLIGVDALFMNSFYESIEFGLALNSSGSAASGVFAARYDFGLPSVVTYLTPPCPIAVSTPLTAFSVAFRGYQHDTVDIYVASSEGIATIDFISGTYGTWKTIYNFPSGLDIKKVAFRDHDALIWAKESFTDRLFIAHRDDVGEDFTVEEISNYFDNQKFGHSEVYDIHTGSDGYYMLRTVVTFGATAVVTRRLYKAGFGNNPNWKEITDDNLATFQIQNIVTEFQNSDNSVIVMAAANNGIWKLSQNATISIDTLITWPSTSALIDSSYEDVRFINSGAAFAYLSRFEFDENAENAFSFADDVAGNDEAGLFLDIRSTTTKRIKFKPSSSGLKTAKLKTYYTVRSSNGSDSTVVVTSRLTGLGKTSQIGLSLKNDTLDMRGVLLNATKSQSFQLFNSGEDNLYITDIYLAKNEIFSIASINGSDSTSFTVTPNRSLSVTIQFDPQSALTYTDTLIIVSSAFKINNTPHPRYRILVKGVGSSIQISNLDNLTASLNQALTIEAALTQIDVSDVSGILRYRKNGETSSAYKTKTMSPVSIQTGNTIRFTTTIAQEEITQNGLEFYVEFTSTNSVISLQYPDNGEYEPQVVSVSIPNPGLSSSGYVSLPGGTGSTAYQLVSFPINLTDKSVGGAFRASNMGEIGSKGDWQVYRYDSNNEKFVSSSDPNITFGNIESGKSYLLISRKPKTLNSGLGRTVKKEDAHVTIVPGWNMLANPYAFDINWADVANFNDNVELTNMVTLQNGRFKYVDETEVYNLKLEPWKGYMYYSPDENGTFSIDYPALNASSASLAKKSVETYNEKFETGEFYINLNLQDGEDETLYRVGASKKALDGFDRSDRVTLPRVTSEEVTLHLINDHCTLNTDMRPVSSDGHVYAFNIFAESGQHMATLSFVGVNVPDGFYTKIIDMSTGLSVASDKLQLPVQAGRPRSYKLIVGTEAFIAKAQSEIIPTQFSLAQNYPNPFNPSTTLRFGLPEASSVKITIYNMLGQQVRILAKQVMPAASHSLLWDGTNDFGQRVASGVYVYRLEATGLSSNKVFSQTRKMTLIK